MNLEAYQGGRTGLRTSLGLAVAGLLVLAAGAAFDLERALFSYLVAFVYFCGIALGALILLSTFHASSARWPVVARRFIEHIPQTLWLFLILFAPIVLGMSRLFVWVAPKAGLDLVMAEAIRTKLPYLNSRFFLVRAAIYFITWLVVATLLRSWSVRQDREGTPGLTLAQRRLAAGSLPLVALTMTFAAFDWMMSLDPRFYSTIFGVYWFAGSFVCAFSVVILGAVFTRDDPNGFGHHLTAEHFHSLGNFLLSFVAFWAYIAFSQFMLIWIANIPEEVPWYILRVNGGWLVVGLFLVVFHFLVPFFLLLSRDRKRDPRRLAYVAGWMLIVHYVDVYWLVMPQLDPKGPRPSLFDLAALVGVGGAATAFLILRMRGTPSVPVKDPYLEDSLRYLPP